jgi:putative methyltransferase (TIGR04325 family)
MLVRLRGHSLTRRLCDLLTGYRRSFMTFAEAQECASRYLKIGHEFPEAIQPHVAFSDVIRESDFPVMFFLAEAAPRLLRVFDLGGCVGNLFYTYQRYLKFSENLVWMVLDLPAAKVAGEELAARRQERRIRYVDSLASASGVDLFIASGSLHYFDQSLPEMVEKLEVAPHYVVVNRTPCSAHGDLFSVQDSGSYLTPCKLHSRTDLITGMEALGYKCRCEWPVYEREFWVPLYPDLSMGHYSGFFFERS